MSAAHSENEIQFKFSYIEIVLIVSIDCSARFTNCFHFNLSLSVRGYSPLAVGRINAVLDPAHTIHNRHYGLVCTVLNP